MAAILLFLFWLKTPQSLLVFFLLTPLQEADFDSVTFGVSIAAGRSEQYKKFSAKVG